MVLGDERVGAVTVTGSETAGRAIAAQAGWLIKKSVLELGGSDPFIVMRSANLDLAIETAVRARCINSGQSCIAAKRFIVAAEIYDEFESRFVAAMEGVRVGDPTKDGTEMGPLGSKRSVEDLEAQVKAAKAAGARILTGGERMLGSGNYFEPTVMVGVPRSCRVYREELSGPVAMLFRADDLSHAIQVANDTPFGLAASAWTREPSEQQRLVTELQCGQVFLNAMVASDPQLPFGGVKRSGYGRELSAAGTRELPNAQTGGTASPVAPPEPRDPRAPPRAVGRPPFSGAGAAEPPHLDLSHPALRDAQALRAHRQRAGTLDALPRSGDDAQPAPLGPATATLRRRRGG